LPAGSRAEPRPVAFLLYCILAKRVWLQHFDSLVSIAMSGEIKANPGSGRIWYLLATYAI